MAVRARSKAALGLSVEEERAAESSQGTPRHPKVPQGKQLSPHLLTELLRKEELKQASI